MTMMLFYYVFHGGMSDIFLLNFLIKILLVDCETIQMNVKYENYFRRALVIDQLVSRALFFTRKFCVFSCVYACGIVENGLSEFLCARL